MPGFTQNLLPIALLALLATARPASAQERCDEATVRRISPTDIPDIATPDIFFSVQIGKPPVVGTAQMAALATTHGSE